MRADALRDGRWRGLRRPAHRLRAGGQREHRRVRSAAGDRATLVRENGGWLHVDGAFGLWAAADPTRRHLVDGVGAGRFVDDRQHKWLNVPYDSGLAFVADPAAHHAAMTLGAAYYVETTGAERDALRLGRRVVTPRPWVQRVCGAPFAGPARTGRAHRADLRACAAVRGRLGGEPGVRS